MNFEWGFYGHIGLFDFWCWDTFFIPEQTFQIALQCIRANNVLSSEICYFIGVVV